MNFHQGDERANAPFQRLGASVALEPLRERVFAGFGETLAEARSAESAANGCWAGISGKRFKEFGCPLI